MNTYIEDKREISVLGNYDVLVLGGGPAGVSAAVTAGRLGAKTMLIEQLGNVGGMSTTGLMSHWTGNTKGGIYEEIIKRSVSMEEEEYVHTNKSSRQTINPENLKTVYLQMLEEANVHIRLYTFASEVIMEDNRLKGVIVESKSGREAIMAKVVIDGTGDGDIAFQAGVDFVKGREEDGLMQPATLMFKIAGVDYSKAVFPGKFEDHLMIPKGDIQKLGEDSLPFPAGHVLLYRTSLPGVVTCNMTNVLEIDGTNVDDLVRATIQCRKQMQPIVDFLRNNVSGYEKCYVISSADLIGIRETRHFKGLYTINEKDIEEGRIFDDWVVSKAHFNFDVHNISGSGLDKTGAQDTFKQKKGYTIPYRCFIPEKIDGLLLSGRNISGTHLAHSNFRAMPICANMGQAVGIAAYIAARENGLPRDVDVKEIQEILKDQGCVK